MTSKERVLRTLRHEETDRVPLDIGGINNTTMHYLVQEKLRKALGLAPKEPLIRLISQGAVVPDDDIVSYFGGDTCCLYFDEARPWIDNGDGSFTDMWGIGQKQDPDGLYYNMTSHPLSDAEDPEDLDDFVLPEPNEYMVRGLKERAAANKDKCLILEGFRESMFGLPSWMRGTENFYVDLLVNEELADALHDKLLAYFKNLLDFMMERLGDAVDIVKLADDMGTQASLLLSPETYRERVKPYQAELISYIKNKYHKPVLFHCCGAIEPIIGDLIEIGVDALNPVQITAAGMDPALLKKKYGDDLVFWGGGVDTQYTLNMGTPDDVRAQVRKNLEIFKPGGGYVFAQVHNIQPDVPVENIIAMYEAYKENCQY